MYGQEVFRETWAKCRLMGSFQNAILVGMNKKGGRVHAVLLHDSLIIFLVTQETANLWILSLR